jgi:hypothetical protein
VRPGRPAASCAALAALALVAPAAAADAPAPRACPTVTVADNSISVTPVVPVGPLTAGEALIEVSNLGCAEANETIRWALTVGHDEVDALARRGLRVRSAVASTRAGQRVRTVVATGSRDRLLTYTTPGRLRVDRSIFRAGQHVNFYRRTSAYACTAAFVVRRRGRLFGLTAGHCTDRADVAVRVRGVNRRPRRPLGPVAWNGDRGRGPDALAFALDDVPLNQAVERGDDLPWSVTGWVRTSAQRSGVRACFAGRTSGADHCGPITKPRYGRGRGRLVCADLELRAGDSGGPVYTEPAGGAVEALGIVTGSRTNVPPLTHGEGCYTPIETILDAFGATLPAGPRPT